MSRDRAEYMRKRKVEKAEKQALEIAEFEKKGLVSAEYFAQKVGFSRLAAHKRIVIAQLETIKKVGQTSLYSKSEIDEMITKLQSYCIAKQDDEWDREQAIANMGISADRFNNIQYYDSFPQARFIMRIGGGNHLKAWKSCEIMAWKLANPQRKKQTRTIINKRKSSQIKPVLSEHVKLILSFNRGDFAPKFGQKKVHKGTGKTTTVRTVENHGIATRSAGLPGAISHDAVEYRVMF